MVEKMSKESKAVYVDSDVHKAIKVFAELEEQDVNDFVRDRVMDYLNGRYGVDFMSTLLKQTNPRIALALISVKQEQMGTPVERTLLGSLGLDYELSTTNHEPTKKGLI